MLEIEQLLARDVNDLTEEEVEFLRTESMKNYMFEQCIKLIINSIYGAFANEFFHFYNVAIAETVTLQGQDAIKHTEKMTNAYFLDFFHRDKELHRALGVPEDQEVPKLVKDPFIYADTDSGYIVFDEAMKAVKWQGSVKDFILRMNEVRLKKFFVTVLEKYAKDSGVENYLDFELETIAENGIWTAKKKYIQNIIWKDGKDYENLSFIKATGLEIIQSSTPLFCRQKLIQIMQLIFSKNDITNDNYTEVIRLIKNVKKEFELSNLEQISMGRSISDYHKYVANDNTAFELRPSCPIHVRAGAYHNFLINQNPKLKGKYQLINSKDKIKWYHAKDDFCNVFAYKAGSHPIEVAPKIDIERQFRATIIDPLNRIIVPAGYQPLNATLAYTIGLF